MSDFEPVNVSSLMVSADSGQAGPAQVPPQPPTMGLRRLLGLAFLGGLIMPGVPFKDEVWPKFLHENARRVLKLGESPEASGEAE